MVLRDLTSQEFGRPIKALKGIEIARTQMFFVGVFSDTERPAAGVAGRLIFNTTDGKLNIDDGTNWTLPDGTTT